MATRGRITDPWHRLKAQPGRGRIRPFTTDLTIVVLLLILDFGAFAFVVGDAEVLEGGIPAPDLISVALFTAGTLIGTLALIARRLYPVTVFLITVGAAVVFAYESGVVSPGESAPPTA